MDAATSDPARLPDADALARHGRFVRALARRLLSDEHAAEDLAQDAWVRYFEAPPRNALDPRGWFTSVVSNLARNRQRSSAGRAERERRTARPEALPPEQESLAQATALRTLVDAVIALDEPYRGTVLARYFKDWEPARIARESGVPLATVKSRLQRAHALLRERLDRQAGGRASWSAALALLSDAEGGALAATTAGAAKIATAALLLSLFAAIAWRAQSDERSPLLLSSSVAVSGVAAQHATELAAAQSAADGLREVVRAEMPATRMRVTGTLRDLPYPPQSLAGGPAIDVEVGVALLCGDGWSPALPLRSSARTDASGRFAVEFECTDVLPDRVRVQVAPTSEFRSADVTQPWPSGQSACDVIELSRARHGLLEGSVVDSEGRPAAGARLALRTERQSEAFEVVTDASGRLLAPVSGVVTGVTSSDPSRQILTWDDPTVIAGGGQSGLRVVLTSSSTLRVRVLDARGRGVPGLPVDVQLDMSELRSASIAERWGDSRPSVVTDEQGLAVIGEVWAGHRLELSIDHERANAARGAELVFERAGRGGAPIVLAPGEARELCALWSSVARIRGRTLDESGRPVARANVELLERAPVRHFVPRARARVQSDAEGRFELEVNARELAGALQLCAESEADPGHASADAPRRSGSVFFEVERLATGETTLDLLLEPTSTITGRIVEPTSRAIAQEGFELQLAAVRSGASALEASSSSAARVEWGEDGAFTVHGLTAGAWDLYVTRVDFSFYTWGHGTQAYRGLPAGSSGHRLVFDPRCGVRVKLRVVGGEIEHALTLRAHLMPRDPGRAFERAERVQRVEGVGGWPTGAPFGFSGISGATDELGQWSFGIDSVRDGREFELPPLAPGVYAIGLCAGFANAQFAPQASEPRAYADGDYVIEFALRPTGTLEGHVTGDMQGQRWAIELLDASGATLALEACPGFGTPSRHLELDARGRFVARHVAVGSFTLRAGPLEQLAAGRAALEQAVQIEPEVVTTVDLRSP